MNKKKRQGDPKENTDDSTESCDENQNMAECTHITKSVDLQRVKKALVKSGVVTECEECNKSPSSNDLEMSSDYEIDQSLWLCLKCGNQACGRYKNQHALKHFQTPRSDRHSLCVNTTSWIVWCYECDDEVNYTCKKKLTETIEYLRKHGESGKNKKEPSNAIVLENNVIDVMKTEPSSSSNCAPIVAGLPRVRGLSNLGNTCFFNSVMQCLGQTPYLLNLLDETSVPGQYFRLPGGKLDPNDKDSPVLEPLDGELEAWRPLTAVLAETLRELQSGRSGVYTPRNLLSRLTQRMPQFGGGDQHDSHELLRHLLEAVREEDLRRYQAVIVDKLGYSRKTDPATVEGEKKKIVRFYGQQASEFLLPTEQVFRGVLISTLQCQECQHTSHRDEFFLDLSLPIAEKQLPPALRRKADEIEDNKPSKYQIKKEKRAAKKNFKKQKNHVPNNAVSFNNPSPPKVDDAKENSDTDTDADVEDNIEEGTSSNNQNIEEIPKGTESGYNSDKIDNGSPDSNNRRVSPDMFVDDSGVPSPAVGMLSVSPCASGSPVTSSASSEANIDLGSPLGGHNSPNEDINDEFDRPESRLSFVNAKNTDLKVDLAKLSLLNDGDSKKIDLLNSDKDNLDRRLEGACGGIEDQDEKMQEDYDTDLWTGTISARYKCEEKECSIQSCLNQFTACELMTGNNKVSCELCTKRHGGPEKKTVYTNATKQLLIYNPPAVLILHLKRFQVHRFRSTKMSKDVAFPFLLDIAPFCSKRSQNLPTFEVGQTRVLYSLYGVVEHSGSIHGGHYVAYVKVRPPLEESSYRWQFLPKNQKKDAKCAKGALADPPTPPGNWYYVSDSYAVEVPEAKVLKAQAYLLFYERIL